MQPEPPRRQLQTLAVTSGRADETIAVSTTPLSEQTAELPLARLVRAMRDEREARRRLLQRITIVYIAIGCGLFAMVAGIGVLEAAGMNVIDAPEPTGQIVPFNAASILASTSSTQLSPSPTATVGLGPVVASDRVPITPTEPSTVASQPAAVAWIEIPSIKVSASVITLGVDADGVMQIPPDPTVVAWYAFSSHPRDPGNAVFAGHLDDEATGPAVFWRLGDLRAGDEITLGLQDGRTLSYQVRSKALVDANPDDSTFQRIVGPTAKPSITIITCTGGFNPAQGQYDQRLVVRAELT